MRALMFRGPMQLAWEEVETPQLHDARDALVRPLAVARCDLDLAIADLEGKASQSRARLNSLERERFTDPAAGLEIGTVEESLKSVEEQLAKKRKDKSELVLTAPRNGIVLPAPHVPPQKDAAGMGKLPGWSGNAIDKRNLGATYAAGTVLCMVGEAERFEAVMLIDQTEVEFIARGQPVDLKLDAFPWQTFTGTVDELAETHLETGSERLSVKAGCETAVGGKPRLVTGSVASRGKRTNGREIRRCSQGDDSFELRRIRLERPGEMTSHEAEVFPVRGFLANSR